MGNVLPLTDTVEQLIPAVCDDGAHSENVVDRTEAAGWETPLEGREGGLACHGSTQLQD